MPHEQPVFFFIKPLDIVEQIDDPACIHSCF
jgi:hypothetical protein